MKIGVISDTHDYFDPQIPALFKGVQHILHAGDIGLPSIISQLKTIAPVTAVLGNNDPGLAFQETEVLTLAGRKFLLHHIIDPHHLSDVAAHRITLAQPDVVIFGHSHKPFNQVIKNRLWFNPGYSGRPRFNQPRSVAILHCTPKSIRAKFHEL